MTTNQYLMPTYARQDVCFESGRGIWLWDNNGKRYLDALSGIAVCNLGHAHPAVTEAIRTQADRLVHTSNIYRVDLQEKLAEKLCSLSGMSNAFFCNSGAEANEAAIKLARRYGHQRGIQEPLIAVMQNSFHGRTMATLSATGNPAIQAGFEPLLPGFTHIPYNDVAALETLSDNANVVAVLLEPVQGEGGVQIPDNGYLSRVRQICTDNGWLMMLDEVQTGIGRTGSYFAFQHEQIQPDVITLAKALGNGVPIGACLATGLASNILVPGSHGSTFGGNPLACAAALRVLEILEQESLLLNAAERGAQIRQALEDRSQQKWGIVHIRNKGMMIGIELDRPCTELVGMALELGLLINVTRGNTIRLLPPLIMDAAQAELLVTTLTTLLDKFSSNQTTQVTES